MEHDKSQRGRGTPFPSKLAHPQPFAEAQRMAQLRYKTYVRKTQENWED